MEKTKRVVWLDEEVENLIDIIRESNIMAFLDGKTKRNKGVFEAIAKEMKKKGYKKNVGQIRDKFKNMKKDYWKIKRCSDSSVKQRHTSQYFDLLDDMLGHQRSASTLDEDASLNIFEDDSSLSKFEVVTVPTLPTKKLKPAKDATKACRSLLESALKTVASQRRPESVSSDTRPFRLSEPYSIEEMAKLDEKVGFIGGGNMAFAIGSGLISRGIVKPGQVLVSGPNLENLLRWRDLGAEVTEDNYEVLDKSDIIFICVKPHVLTPCATQLRGIHEPTTKDKEKLFVSVLAGVNLKSLEESFNFIVGLKMIRTMPNTSMQVGEGCTVYTAGTYVKQQDLEKVHLMLNSLGIAQQVPESMIDAVTGVAGCGPAYVYTFIESLADGAVKEGVPRQMALQFAAQMVLGAAKTVLITGKHPAVLRDEVCSPGGSTIVGVHELEKGNFRATVINAVEKSSKRSAELGKK